MTALRRTSACIISIAIVASAGCAAAPRPAYLEIEPNQYHAAFDAAEEVARSFGLVPAFRDRRAGIVETEPIIAGSLLEPWNRTTRSFEQALESTLSFQRKRARFEFHPVISFLDPPESAQLTGPDLLAFERSESVDLTRTDQPLELRVWVYNERAHIPGIQRSAWSRRMTTYSQVMDPETGRAIPGIWSVVSRDRALEAHMLAAVADSLAR